MMSPNVLSHSAIHQDLVEHVDNQQRFQIDSYSLVYFAAVPTSRLGFLEPEVKRA